MCHLNILISDGKTPISKILGFISSVTAISHLTMNDGEGFYSNGLCVCSRNKINYLDYAQLFTDSKFILIHNRLATSGLSSEFTQPFNIDGFVFLHNGNLTDFNTNKNSDSYNAFSKFTEEFKKIDAIKDNISNENVPSNTKLSPNNNEITRDKNIIATIKNVFDNCAGSFSIALFDTITKRLYYFKNDIPNINCKTSGDIIYLTTSDDNLKFLPMFSRSFRSQKIKDHRIYRFTVGDLPTIEVVGKIKPRIVTQTTTEKNYKWAKNYSKAEKKYTSCVFCGSNSANYCAELSCYLCRFCEKQYTGYNYV